MSHKHWYALLSSAELPTKKADYFEGHMIWDICTQRKPDVIGFEVTDVKAYDYFTPVVDVRLSVNGRFTEREEIIDKLNKTHQESSYSPLL